VDGTIGRVGRRTVAVLLVAVLGAGGLVGCSADDRTGDPPPSPAGSSPAGSSPASRTPASPSGRASGQAPVAPVPVTPPPGTAPTRAFAVGTRRLHLSRGRSRPLPTSVWYPALGSPDRRPAVGAEPADGPFPVVLFSHGLTAAPGDYATILSRWARAGFVVAAPAYPFTSTGVARFNPLDVLNQPADASEVLTRVLALNATAGDPFEGRLDIDRIAAAGHSAGGVTTVGLFTGNRDERLDAGIVLAGRQLLNVPFRGTPAPMLFVHGRKDKTVRYAEGLSVFRAVPWSRAMLAITDGGHLARGRDYDVAIATSVDFLRWSLYGDPAAKSRIPADAARRGVATLIDDL
jgi:dienelactone hydrolase